MNIIDTQTFRSFQYENVPIVLSGILCQIVTKLN